MTKLRLHHLAVLGILVLFPSACAPSTPTHEFAGPIGGPPTDIAIAGAVEDLVIVAGVKVGLCLVNPDFCSPYSLEIEEDCEKDPQTNRECCVAIASLRIQPEVFKPKLPQLRDEFAKYEDRNGRRPLLPDDLEWIVKLNEQILEEWFEGWYVPEVTATSEPWIACQEKETKEEIMNIFETRVQSQYGKLFRMCLMQPECFLLTSAMITPMPDFSWNALLSVDRSEAWSWATPGPEVPFGTDCAWIYAPPLLQIGCPQPRLTR